MPSRWRGGTAGIRPEALLEQAQDELELAQTVVRAPTDGFVTQHALRPGAMTLPIGLKPVMTFIHKQERTVVAWFRQNSLLRLENGQAAIYTEHFHHVGIFLRVLLRMNGWMNYVFPIH